MNRKKATMTAANRKSRPLYTLLAALLVLAAGSLYLALRVPAQTMTLTTAQGGATEELAALEGFTFTVAVRDERLYNAYTMENGTLRRTDAKAITPRYIYSAYSTDYLTVPAADRARLEAAATQNADGSRQISASRLDAVCTVQLADHTSVRFPVATLDTSAPVTLTASVYRKNGKVTSYSDYDVWMGQEAMAPEVDAWYGAQRFCEGMQYHNGQWEFAFAPANCTLPAGIYRVEKSLTEAEVAALPADVTVDGQPLLAYNTAYGTIAPVYTLPQGGSLLGWQYTSGGLCVVYRTGDEIRADAVDETGSCTDTLLLQTITEKAKYDTQSLDQLRPDCYTMVRVMNDGQDMICFYYLLQLKDGKFETAAVLESASPLTGVLLNESGQTLLTVEYEFESANGPATAYSGATVLHSPKGMGLRVYPLEQAAGAHAVQVIDTGTEQPLLHAVLDGGAIHDWPYYLYTNSRAVAFSGYCRQYLVPDECEILPAPQKGWLNYYRTI